MRHPRLHPFALAAALCLGSPTAGALDTFTGSKPVYVGSWFNGSFTEVQEFQFALDWQGWCSARVGANCQSIRFWNVAGNWDGNAIPNALSGDARVTAGNTVRVGQFNSVYLGGINGQAVVSTLSSAGRVEVAGVLRVGNASFADLSMFVTGRLETSGLSSISNLSSGWGDFGGAGGTTRLLGWQGSNLADLQLLVRTGHKLEMASAPSLAPLAIRLEPTARMSNLAQLNMNGGSIGLQGTANLSTLPVFDNLGTLAGGGTLASTRFNNSGSVLLAANERLALGLVGSHTGSFSASSGSELSFGGVGGASQQFLAGSSMNSAGVVVAGRGRHQVSGNWTTSTLRLVGGSQVDFDGPTPQIDVLEVGGDSLNVASFNSVGGVQLQTATLNQGRIEFNQASNTVQNLNLQQGSLFANSALTVAQTFEWQSGFLQGGATVSLPGQTNLLAGTRAMNANVDLTGTLNWQAGSFSQWSRHMKLAPSARFIIEGDFSSAGGGGSITSRGLISKTQGSGRAELAMAVNNDGGQSKVASGTLALTGGGVHTRGSFEALAGSRIELSGGTVFSGSVTRSGRLDIVGGGLSLQNGVQYTHGAGHRLEIDDLTVQAGSRLATPDALVVRGNVLNAGTLAPAAAVEITGDFRQFGDFSLVAGASLSVGGNGIGLFTNARPLVLTNSPFFANQLFNTNSLTLTGSVNATLVGLQNDGQLTITPTSGFAAVWVGDGTNTGTLRLDGATSALQMGGSFGNGGTIVNEGFINSGLSFLHAAGSRMDNIGQLNVDGDLGLAAGSQFINTGRLNLQSGRVIIDAGATLNSPGLYIQYDGQTFVNGLVVAGQGLDIQGGELRGTGTVQGSVNLGPTAVWRPGNSPGTFTVNGDTSVAGALEIEIDSLSVHDRLVVSGNFNSWGPLDLVFGAGFQAQDGDLVQWLQAGSASVNGSVNVCGLATNWSANVRGGVVEVTDNLAIAIPLSGSYSIAANQVGFNALPGPQNMPSLDRLDNAGTFSNRTGAAAQANTFNNSGLVLNRGNLESFMLVSNSGEWRNLSGSSVGFNRVENTGQWLHSGSGDVNTLDNSASGRIELRSGSSLSAYSLTNEGDMTVQGSLGVTDRIANRGRFEVAAGGSVIIDSNISVFNGYEALGDQAVTRVDGLLQARQIMLNGSSLQGIGILRGDVIAGYSNSNISPGNSVGTLTIDGDLKGPYLDPFDTGAQLKLELNSPQSYDRLIVSGDARIGFVTFLLPDNFRPNAGDSFSVLSVGGLLDGYGTSNWRIDAQDGFGGSFTWGTPSGVYDPSNPNAANLRLSFANGTLSVTAVPEPQSWALMLAGLLAVGWFKRRAYRA